MRSFAGNGGCHCPCAINFPTVENAFFRPYTRSKVEMQTQVVNNDDDDDDNSSIY